jgi:hypothetical protein
MLGLDYLGAVEETVAPLLTEEEHKRAILRLETERTSHARWAMVFQAGMFVIAVAGFFYAVKRRRK